MFPLRCLSLLLFSAVVIHCNDVATETLIEMKGDKLGDEQTTESERVKEKGVAVGERFNEVHSKIRRSEVFHSVADSTESDENELRNINKDYDRLGKVYVAQYYRLFDDTSRRLSLVSLYHSEDSFLSMEGEKYRGTKNILKKYEELKLKKVERSINSVDSQPLQDGGIIINVIGKVTVNSDPTRLYAQTFIFKPQKGSFFLQHDIFRTIQD